ncbi:hypothetical protein F511_36631 [Dorcoceras hygrometricum]|uniref:Uncharacterized protein n=1 Tax=Dorcoceras hygrometricum TaxID=472368 RepID=A0A2Z7AX06_9LAMI|nr:hypothetical protein F511_36631 [Dorcoceras hygrometricum]
MGCPEQARTKPRSKNHPSQQSAGDRRRKAAAATMLRAALGRTPVAPSTAHGAGCANQWHNVSLLAGHLKRTAASTSLQDRRTYHCPSAGLCATLCAASGSGHSWPLRNNCAGQCTDMRAPLRGQRACAARAYAVSMTFRVVRTNQYNQDLGLIHSTNSNHLENPNEGCSIDHQVTIYLHAQNITMFPTNETWYFASQILVSSSGGLILVLTAQSTRNVFRIHSDY